MLKVQYNNVIRTRILIVDIQLLHRSNQTRHRKLFPIHRCGKFQGDPNLTYIRHYLLVLLRLQMRH